MLRRFIIVFGIMIVIAAVLFVTLMSVSRRSEVAAVRQGSEFFAQWIGGDDDAALSYLSDRFRMVASDPRTSSTVTCGIDAVSEIKVGGGAAFMSGATIGAGFSDGANEASATVFLVKEGGEWKIDAISCTASKPSSSVPSGFIYLYDSLRDKDADGNPRCDSSSVAAVPRPGASEGLEEALRLVFSGSITAEESARGFSTEFPLRDVVLRGVRVDGPTAILAVDDPSNATSGGSCRVGILRAQIESTAKQFPGIMGVSFEPIGVFEP